MNWLTALKLGRVSNLPTVWSNTLAGTLLAGGMFAQTSTWLVLLAMSFFYIGGMYLNDAFDASIDAQERPERPIPAGLVSRNTVLVSGFAMLLLGELILISLGLRVAFVGLLLAGVILAYNLHHKNNPLSPFLMGLCRVCIYFAAGYAVSADATVAVSGGALMLLCHLIGLTYVAKQENLGKINNSWPLLLLAVPVVYGVWHAGSDWLSWLLILCLAAWIVLSVSFITAGKPGGIPKGVVSLIAGIALLDAVLISSTGHGPAALLAVLCFGLTLMFQRVVPGT